MILHSITARGFKCIQHQAKLDIGDASFVVLSGQNGIGKSTLLTALITAFFESHTARAAGVRELKSWGAELSPWVCVEFDHNGRKHKVEKRFLNGSHALWSEWDGEKYILKGEGDAVETFLRSVFKADSGASGEKWGIARALWSPQDSLALEGLKGGAKASVHDLLGAQAIDARSAVLKKAITTAYDGYWTSTGQVKRGANEPIWRKLESELPDLDESKAVWRSRSQELNSAQLGLGRLSESMAQRSLELTSLAETFGSLNSQQQEFQPLQSKKGEKSSRRVAVQVLFEGVSTKIEGIESKIRLLGELTTELNRLRSDLPKTEEAAERANQRFVLAQRDLGLANHPSENLAGLRRDFAEAIDLNQTLDALAIEERKFSSIQSLMDQLEAKTTAYKSIRKPDETTLRRWRSLDSRLSDNRIRLQSALLRWKIKPETNLEIQVMEGSPAGIQALRVGVEFEFTGSPSIRLQIDGIGEMTLSGPPSSVKEIEDELERLESELLPIKVEFPEITLSAAEENYRSANDLLAESRSFEQSISSTLEGQNLDGLNSSIGEKQARLKDIRTAHPVWLEERPNSAELKLEIEKLEGEIEEAKARAFSEHRLALEEHQVQSQSLSNARIQLDNKESTRATTETELRSLTADTLDVAELKLKQDEFDRERKQLDEDILALDKRLDNYPKDLEDQIRSVSGRKDSLDEAQAAEKSSIDELKGSTKSLLEEAPSAKLAVIELEIEEKVQSRDEDKLRADSLKLLKETCEKVIEEATSNVARPVAEEASKIFRLIAGAKFEGIEIDSDLCITGIRRKEAPYSVPLEKLSGGEREQVYLALRIALAKVLTQPDGSRELLVIDDALAATDQERLERAMQVLQGLSDKIQTLVLTCHPERYSALAGLRMIEVEPLLSVSL